MGVALVATEEMGDEEKRAALRFARVLETIDRPVSRGDRAPPVILFELFGSGKTMKSTIAVKLRQFFSRYGARVMLPPEGAEIEAVRGLSEEDPQAFQELHIAYVLETVLRFSESRVFQVVGIDRGILDMRGWLLNWVRSGKMSEEVRREYDELLLRSAALRRMTAFYHCVSAPEVSLEREFAGSITKKRGKKMNERDLAQMHDVWNWVCVDTQRRMPQLPILKVDTTDGDIERAGREILNHLLDVAETKFLRSQ